MNRRNIKQYENLREALYRVHGYTNSGQFRVGLFGLFSLRSMSEKRTAHNLVRELLSESSVIVQQNSSDRDFCNHQVHGLVTNKLLVWRDGSDAYADSRKQYTRGL